MKKYILLLFFFFFFVYCRISFAQCSGGVLAGTFTPSLTQQTMAINGNSYYTFYAVGGDHYRFRALDFYDKEITILDSVGNYAGGYNHSPSGDGFTLIWTPALSGTYRALINSFPCTSFSGNLGSMYYIWVPNRFFPKDSAQWSMRFLLPDGSIGSLQYKMKGDTLLNGISYNKIYTDTNINYSYNDSAAHCFIRQDTSLKKVYVRYPYAAYQDSSEYVLYDFDVQVGDTIMVHLFLNNINYPIWITNEDIGQFNFDYRRYVGIQVVDTCPNPPCLWGPWCDYSTSWTEGMGSDIHFLYPEIGKDSCVNTQYLLVCFWHNGQYVFGGTFCDYHTGISENSLDISDKFLVVPNPISDISIIDLRGGNFERIETYNILGEQVERYEIDNIHKIILSKKNYEGGIYICKLFFKDGKYFTSKFIAL